MIVTLDAVSCYPPQVSARGCTYVVYGGSRTQHVHEVHNGRLGNTIETVGRCVGAGIIKGGDEKSTIKTKGLAEPGFEVLEAFLFLLREAGRQGEL